MHALRKAFEEDGYAVARGVLDAASVARLAAVFDRVRERVLRPEPAPELRVLFGGEGGRTLRLVQRDGHVDDATCGFATDPRVLALVTPLLGRPLRIVINSLFYKPPGTDDDHVGYHQDWRFRRPPEAYRDLAHGYVQLGIAVDAHGPDNGGLEVVARSHRRGDLGLCKEGGVSRTPLDERSLAEVGLDPRDLVALRLAPGDVALWSAFTVHGSAPNRSTRLRRFFVCGFAAATTTALGDLIT